MCSLKEVVIDNFAWRSGVSGGKQFIDRERAKADLWTLEVHPGFVAGLALAVAFIIRSIL